MGDRDVRVCVFGDSFAVGVGDPAGLGWLGRVARRKPDDVALTTYNLGVRGDTSAHVVARFEAELALRLRVGAENKVLVSFGVNDTMLDDGAPRRSTEESCAGLGALIDATARRALPLLVVGPTPVADDDHNARTATVSAAFAELCDRRAIPYVEVCAPLRDSVAWTSEILRGDGAHPAEAGYQEMADLVLPAWTRLLAAPTPDRRETELWNDMSERATMGRGR
ncbi:GDSL-type esterase/lipase family protein [Pseudonocardia lutea]|uniref:GDSL-type esterase/lipase family protein n=1 Tax=Pseudonocardia lutea TaxID=2172015 RepID=A0ABW1I1I3_9PSEU